MANTDRVEAQYYRREGEAFVCELCQQKCFIRDGEFGLCGTRRADSDILIEQMHGETPQEPEELPEKLIESVNEGALVNEGENKRIRNITFVFFGVIGLAAVALLWLVILVIVHYVRAPEPAPGPEVGSGTVQQAEEPVSQTVHMEESELDALIVPETPSISVLKMSKVPGVRESL